MLGLKPQPQTLKPNPYLYEFSGGPVGLPGLPGALAAFFRCASALSRCDLCFGALGASAGLGCFGYGVSGFKNFSVFPLGSKCLLNNVELTIKSPINLVVRFWSTEGGGRNTKPRGWGRTR